MKRNVLLAVSGSISAYKSYDVMRGLIKQGHKTKVILTQGAEKFIRLETFRYLGADAVYSSLSDFSPDNSAQSVLHIELRKWMDLLIIVPASANTIARLANGLCSDLLGALFLANTKKQTLIFPAMNTQMYHHPILQENLKKLQCIKNLFIHEPDQGTLACHEVGLGKLPTIETIVDFICTYPLTIKKKKVLITTGATNAPLDPIRYLTNPASGKTGYELTKYYLSQGHEVYLIYGLHAKVPISNLQAHPRLTSIAVNTTQDMYQAVQKHFASVDIYISSAAVSDISFTPKSQKIKKEAPLTSLSFTWAVDILQAMLEQRDQQIIISFAAETENLDQNFRHKWKRKPVDLLVGNKVNNGVTEQALGFGTDDNYYYMIEQGKVTNQMAMSKQELARYIYNFTESQHASNIQ